MIRLSARRAALVVVLAAAVPALGACGGGDGRPAAVTQPDGGSSTTTTAGGGLPGEGDEAPVDRGPFCTSIGAIQALGGDAGTASPEQVLAQNEQLLDLLDEAAATVPEGAPADVESLIDDYRKIGEAIGAAGGDTEAAYAALEESDPALAARLFNATAHLPAFEFFASRCGIDLQ